MDFTFTASGSVSGPINRLAYTANYVGTGTVICDGEEIPGSLSGSLSGTLNLNTGKGTQRARMDDGQGAFSGTMAVTSFVTESSEPEDRGDRPQYCSVPSPLPLAASAATTSCTLRRPQFLPGRDGKAWTQDEIDRVMNLINNLPPKTAMLFSGKTIRRTAEIQVDGATAYALVLPKSTRNFELLLSDDFFAVPDENKIKFIFAHEAGHAVALLVSDQFIEFDKTKAKLFGTRFERFESFVPIQIESAYHENPYSAHNANEQFATAYAMFVYEKDLLKAQSPGVYEFFMNEMPYDY